MKSPVKTLLYVGAIVLIIVIPLILRRIVPVRSPQPGETLSPPGLPEHAGGPSVATPVLLPPGVSAVERRRDIRNPAPGAFAPPVSEDGPSEALRREAQQKNVPADEFAYGFARRLLAEGGDTATHTRDLLASDDVRMRAIGVVTLLESTQGDLDQLEPLLDEEDVPSILWAAGWLNDHGQFEDASGLLERVAGQGLSLLDFHGLMESGTLGGSAGRAALQVLTQLVADDQLADEYVWVTQRDELPYSVRMMAAVFLGDALEPYDHLFRIRGLANQAASEIRPDRKSRDGAIKPEFSPETGPADVPPPGQEERVPVDPLWVSGLMKLAAELKSPGPVELSPLSAISPFDVQRAASLQSPSSLEDLALRLEYVAGVAEPQVYAGTTAALAALLETLPETPVTETFGIAKQRLLTAGLALEALEDPDLVYEDVPPGVTGP